MFYGAENEGVGIPHGQRLGLLEGLLLKMSIFWQTVCLWIATALYVGQAGVLAYSGKFGFAATFTGYALANLGLIWAIIYGR